MNVTGRNSTGMERSIVFACPYPRVQMAGALRSVPLRLRQGIDSAFASTHICLAMATASDCGKAITVTERPSRRTASAEAIRRERADW